MILILRAKAITKAYRMGRHTLTVLRGASLDVARGEFVAVMGASGAGKSTLLHILGVLDTPDSGEVLLEGQDVFRLRAGVRERLRNRQIGFVFQFYHLLPELSVFENVMMPQLVQHSLLSWFKERGSARRAVEEAIESVGLSDRSRHRPKELSGGERQRVALARALVNRPTLLLADEPTGNLDEATGRGILKVLADLHAGGQTIVIVTHDRDVASLADRCVHLRHGRMETGDDTSRHRGEPVQSGTRR